MARATLIRALLAVVLAVATVVDAARAQNCITNICPPNTPPPNTPPIIIPPVVTPPVVTPPVVTPPVVTPPVVTPPVVTPPVVTPPVVTPPVVTPPVVTPPVVTPIVTPPPVTPPPVTPPAATPPITLAPSGRSGSPAGPDNSGSHSHHNIGLYILGGLAILVIGWAIKNTFFSNGNPFDQAPPPSGLPPPPEPSLPPITQIQPPGLTRGAGAGQVARLRNGFNLPPIGETHFVPDEVLFDIPPTVSEQTLNAIAAQLAMTRLESIRVKLTGRTLHRWHIDGGQSVPTMIRTSAGIRHFAGAQPNYLYALMEDAASSGNSEQYAPEKLEAPEAHRLATGNRVLVAVIDSGVDPSHPDLAGAIAAHFDPAGDEQPHPHGTGMAGAIAARGTVLGIAPRAELLTVRAFSSQTQEAEGTTLNIIKGLDWAAEKGARVVNMSFAGPADPRLAGALAKANAKGIVLIAAAGNAGPNSPPLYPAADSSVIAVTATDTHDALFAGANRGKYIAVAAPGVDVLVPAPDSAYQLTTGTSVAAAEVSGVVAMLIERNPSLTPKDVRRILMRTARHLGPSGDERDFGAGLVNALQAVKSATPADIRRRNEPGCRSGQTAPCPAGKTSMHGAQ
jgi:hypothetical protein